MTSARSSVRVPSGLLRNRPSNGSAGKTRNPLYRLDSMDQDLVFEVKSGIARITINRPEARNAFTFEMYEKLAQSCEAINSDDSIKVLVLTGAGEKAFSAGTDISLFKSFKTPDDALGYESFIDRVLGSLERCRVPTIAAIAGACTGGGGAIAACCDLRIGTEDAKFGFPIARTLGNCLSIRNLARLSGLIGPARVKDIIFTARLVPAKEAHEIGLLTWIVKDRAALDVRTQELAEQICGFAPLTLRATKEGLRRLQALDLSAQDLILMCYMSEDFREGMAAFLEKRTPNWQGR
jgi:enoyl-CoA hydratase